MRQLAALVFEPLQEPNEAIEWNYVAWREILDRWMSCDEP
jgi:hypothetical protein